MKNVFRKFGILPAGYLSLLCMTSACSQDQLENSSISEPVPVILSTTVSKIQTRVNGSSFEKEDWIGLFILEQPKKLEEERFADNVLFTCNGTDWIADRDVFYPSSDIQSTFWAYYPYRTEGIATGKSSLNCEVKTDQSVDQNYVSSDFLVAFKSDIVASKDAVPLIFKHKLTAIEIILDPGNAFPTAQALLEANPLVTVKGVYTRGEYDFQSGIFTSQSDKGDLVPAGEFVVNENKLYGKKCIVVPQSLPAGHILIELTVGNKNFSFTLGEAYQFRSGTRETYTLTLSASMPENIPGKIAASVSDWENDSSQSGDLIEKDNQEGVVSDCYSIGVPDFATSSVYKVMNGRKQIAEICKEYLVAKNIDNQAIVVYPLIAGKTDYTKGIVLQVLDGNAGRPLSEMIHGGSVSWDVLAGSLTYIKGNSQSLNGIYIDSEGTISTIPGGGGIASTTLESDLLVTDGGNTKYPVVKVGMQYWMGQNLKSTSFTDKSPIPCIEETNDWKTATKAYCHYKETDEILYKYNTVLEKMEPENWKVPAKSDWNQLGVYVKGDALFIKDSSWNVTDNKLNLTGLSVKRSGLRLSDGTFYDDSPGFWHTDGGYIYFAKDIIKEYENETSCGCSLRLIRK